MPSPDTGIEGFDDWARQLVETGWLHSHTRMWFASIWIFTIQLPWTLGADHFLRHLLDGDPASNTLSWRWVAGLHTRGKHYVARAENIRRYTEGRFAPTGLNENPVSLEERRTCVGHTVAAAQLGTGGRRRPAAASRRSVSGKPGPGWRARCSDWRADGACPGRQRTGSPG